MGRLHPRLSCTHRSDEAVCSSMCTSGERRSVGETWNEVNGPPQCLGTGGLCQRPKASRDGVPKREPSHTLIPPWELSIGTDNEG